MVDGSYEYYHYNHDNINDSGWGCAYRSMQTICSWIRLQNYTERTDDPSHLEIQKLLVKIGDKEKNFINSTNWIGAIEISLCLNELYGVHFVLFILFYLIIKITCNIIHVSSGDEIRKKSKELIQHFEIHGTPVMIGLFLLFIINNFKGGGVLAYTLLGIDYNNNNEEIRFLILDPHYTGIDDIKIIKEKGWCSWKTIHLFRKNYFYNILLPRRPQSI